MYIQKFSAYYLKKDDIQNYSAYIPDFVRKYQIFIIFIADIQIYKDMESSEIEAFLTDLAVNRKVAASTQNQALNTILFLYREVLKQDLDLKVDAVRAKPSKYLPTVLTKDEVLAIIQKLSGTNLTP
ncbi:putative transposase [Nostoc carneum NIES-2107]|nr:putative transposase [Nostoc carneum NIES-2107]